MAKRALSRHHTQVLQLGFGLLSARRLVLCGFLFSAAGTVMAQPPQAEKLPLKIAQIEKELQPQFGAVRLHRVEELEDDIFTPTPGNSNPESPFILYQVQQRRYFVTSGEILQNLSASSFSVYLAISRDGERVYRFAGFPDPGNSFRQLLADFHVAAPRDRDSAESRALYCARVVFGQEPQQWIVDERQAQKAVSDYLFERRKSPPRGAAEWLRDYLHDHPRSNLNLITTVTADGTFLTRLPLFWAPVEGDIRPEFQELQIKVNRDGSCQRVGATDGIGAQHR
jgi:hypothetical protein